MAVTSRLMLVAKLLFASLAGVAGAAEPRAFQSFCTAEAQDENGQARHDACNGPTDQLAFATMNANPLTRGEAPVNASVSSNVFLGVYDPHRTFARDRAVGIEHIFIYWQALDLAKFRQQLAYAEKRNRTIMVTVEPYTRAANWRDGGERLFRDIVQGKFKPEIDRICTELSRFKGPVLIRWGHEMEDPTGRYPWARKDKKGFKSAFRHFVTECRGLAPDAAFLWSPKGEKNLRDYYPGDGYVDYVGLSVWGLQAMDVDFFGSNRRFESTFSEKYNRVVGFNKPVIIAELGVSGDRNYRRDWFEDLIRSVSTKPSFSLLRAVVYFNDREPSSWPMNYGSPDWRIEADWFSRAEEFADQRRPSLL